LEREVERLAGENMGEETRIKTIAIASFIGTAIEAYDLYIYGFAAAFVLGRCSSRSSLRPRKRSRPSPPSPLRSWHALLGP